MPTTDDCTRRSVASPCVLDPPGPEPVGLGRFGEFGGRFVPETLVPALEELEARVPRRVGVRRVPRRVRRAARGRTPAGPRRSPSATGSRSGSACGCCSSARTSRTPGSHKINNVLGQALLTRRMGKQRVIAETGAGQHGVATATAAALFGLDCMVFMGAVDVERQALNVFRMQLLGAEVVAGRVGERARSRTRSTRRCATGSRRSRPRTTASARSSARIRTRGWCASSSASSATKRASSAARSSAATTPTSWSRASAAGSNAIGTFAGFLDTDARLVGVEAGGLGLESGQHGASVSRGVPGRAARRAVAVPPGRGRPDPRGALDQRRASTTRASAPSTPRSPATGRAEYQSATDDEALAGFQLLAVDRGHRARARARARDRLARAGVGTRGADRAHRAGHALGPGRQGRRAGRRAPRRGEPTGVKLEAHLRARRDAGRKLLVPYVTGGLGAGWLDVVARRRRRRRRRDRDRHPVLRPGDGRAHDPGGVAARARHRRDARRRSSPRPRDLDVDVPLVGDDLLQPGRTTRATSASRRRSRTPASTARSCPTSRSTSSTAGPTRPTTPASRPCCSPRRPRPTTGCARSASASRGFVYGVALMGVTGERERARGAGRRDGPRAARPSPTSRCCSASASRRRSRRSRPPAAADGVIVGSALDRRVCSTAADAEGAHDVRRELRAALDAMTTRADRRYELARRLRPLRGGADHASGSTRTTSAGSPSARSARCRWSCGAATAPSRRPPSSSTCTRSSPTSSTRALRVRALRRRQHAQHPRPLPRARPPEGRLLRPRPPASFRSYRSASVSSRSRHRCSSSSVAAAVPAWLKHGALHARADVEAAVEVRRLAVLRDLHRDRRRFARLDAPRRCSARRW